MFLEINTLPGLTRASFIPQQLEAAGIEMAGFLGRQLEIGRARRDAVRRFAREAPSIDTRMP